MKRLKIIIATCLVMVGIAATPLAVSAADENAGSDGNAATKISDGLKKVGGDKNTVSLEDQIKTIVNVMLFLLGAIAVIMIIIGGIRYATSNGDASATKAAKDTVLYAVIGLVVAILAYAIVGFIVNTAFKSS
jgi:hypothetical protein